MTLMKTRISASLQRWRRPVQMIGTVVGISAAAIGGYCGYLRYTGNIQVVRAGELYRSAQLDADEFIETISKYHVKSILNLRGKDPGERWYQTELNIAHELGVRHFDYGIWASNVVTDKQIDDILRIVRDAPKPLLIHCNGGADRSGLVAALYLAEIEGMPAQVAAGQLSLVYGHFPYLGSRTGAMDASFWRYVKRNPQLPKLRSGTEQIVQDRGHPGPH